jgi:hypothetical protein
VDALETAGSSRGHDLLTGLEQSEFSGSIDSSYSESGGRSRTLSEKEGIDMEGPETSQDTWRIVFSNSPNDPNL